MSFCEHNNIDTRYSVNGGYKCLDCGQYFTPMEVITIEHQKKIENQLLEINANIVHLFNVISVKGMH